MPADTDRERLPFEPTRKRKKSDSKSAPAPTQAAPQTTESKPSPKPSKPAGEDVSVPEVVSRRMLRRMIIFSGIPVALGVAIFFVSYLAITRHIVELPNVAVLLVTLGCFGLSVVGLSYGALSASWEEDAVGGLIGFDHFKLNFGRLTNSWQEAREARRNKV